MIKKLKLSSVLKVLGVFSLIVSLAIAINPSNASAVSGSDWNASRIIDDSVYFNSGTMNTGDIQNFLNAKVPSCDTNGTQPSGRSGYPTRADWGRANNEPPPYRCLKDYTQDFPSKGADAFCGAITGGNKSAANIIFDVSRACGINPQAIIVLLQKEQSLVTDDWPWSIQYRSATGYGCPDTAPCDSEYYGFFNQVYNAARQSKRYVQQASLFNYAVGRNSYVQYNPNAGCGGTNLTLQTQATAVLYNYTPYQPNQAALNNLYGTGDGCSAYGNRNFWRMFNDWFGSTSGDNFILAKSDDPNDLRQWVIYGGIKQYVPSAEIKRAWGLPDQLTEVSGAYLGSIPNGPNLDRLMRNNRQPGTLYFVDNGRRYAIANNGLVDTWGLGSTTTSYVSQGLFNLPIDGGYLSPAIKHPSNDTLYMTDGLNGSNQLVIRPYQDLNMFRAWEGNEAWVTEVSADLFGIMDDAVGSTLTTTKMTTGIGENQVVAGSRYNQPQPYAQLYPGSAMTVSTATATRLPYRGSVSHLVKSNSSPTVYMLDAGTKHQILWPDALTAWTPPGAGILTANDAYLAAISDGASIGSYAADVSGQLYVVDQYKTLVPSGLDTAYRNALSVYTASSALMDVFPNGNPQAQGFIKGRNTPQVYLLDNSGNKRHIQWPDKLALWGGTQGVVVFSDYVLSAIGNAANPELFVSDGSSEYLMAYGQKLSVDGATKAEWGLSGAQTYSDGTLTRFPTTGALDTKARGNGAYIIIRDGNAYATADPNIADVWAIDDAPSIDVRAITNQLPVYPLTRFVRSSTDNRTFLIDNGTWYNLDVGPKNNITRPQDPIMTLDPANAPTSITDWTSFMIKSGSGAHWVIEGGGRRNFPAQMIQDHWTNFGNVTVPTVTDGFINLLPYHGIIERTIKGTSPMVYSAEGGTKRHILYSDTYNRFYAPFGSVSERLLDTMPNGAPIN